MNFIVHKMWAKRKIYSNNLIKYKRRSKLVGATYTYTQISTARGDPRTTYVVIAVI